MARNRVNVAWIANDSARKSTFRKRRKGLLKKVQELTVLCGVNAFLVIHSPDDQDDQDQEPIIWPSREAVQNLLTRLQNVPEVDRCKKTFTQETYLKDRVVKLQENLTRLEKKNQEMEMNHLMDQMDQGQSMGQFQTSELFGLFWGLKEKIEATQRRIEYYQHFSLPSVPPPGVFDALRPAEEVVVDEMGLTNQWVMEMMRNDGEIGFPETQLNEPGFDGLRWFVDQIGGEGFTGLVGQADHFGFMVGNNWVGGGNDDMGLLPNRQIGYVNVGNMNVNVNMNINMNENANGNGGPPDCGDSGCDIDWVTELLSLGGDSDGTGGPTNDHIGPNE